MIKISKKLYLSKTLIINFIALVALFAQMQTGFVMPVEEQTAIVIVINLLLRMVTGEPLET